MGLIGFEQRMDYAAIGTVVNLASRLCSEAANGEILITKRVAAAVASTVNAERRGEVSLKGLTRPTEIYRILQSN
jgi:class 3 adenylate cyclase